MKIAKKILSIGNSKAITLPKEIAKKVSIGDLVLFEVKVREILSEGLTNYKCLACEHRFIGEKENAYCPACENENLEVIENE